MINYTGSVDFQILKLLSVNSNYLKINLIFFMYMYKKPGRLTRRSGVQISLSIQQEISIPVKVSEFSLEPFLFPIRLLDFEHDFMPVLNSTINISPNPKIVVCLTPIPILRSV